MTYETSWGLDEGDEIAPGRSVVRDLGTPMVLIDGFVRGTWKLVDGEVQVETFAPLSDDDAEAVHEEGERLAAFATGAPAVARP